MEALVTQIRERYEHTLERIAKAAQAGGRDPESVRLVVVTKAQPLEVVQAAVNAGAHLLGENYPEESVSKISFFGHESGVEWHMIGHVQSRKARLVIEHFDLLQSLDSLKLAKRLDWMAREAGRILPVMLEFNVGGEESKYGWLAAQEQNWPALYPVIESILDLENLEIRGLMTMPPLETDPDDARVYFRTLRLLRDHLAARFSQVDWYELSMGTSADFEVAVQEDATLVRIGTAIVGPRPDR
ncbi:MAG: YggS family pyridoxal phosphate-dependent enzyme [Anaerolineales bacterium]|jgi:pyridoxal phosphate enzyme (YggS family)